MPSTPKPIVRPDDSPLFPDAYVASEAAWPTFPQQGTIAEIRPSSQVLARPEPSHDPHMGVREFSVMIRQLGKNVHHRNLLKAAIAGGIAILLIGGLSAYLIFWGNDDDAGSVSEITSNEPMTRYETPTKIPKVQKELPKASILENVDYPTRSSAPRAKAQLDEGLALGTGSYAEAPYTPPPPAIMAPPKLAQIDPSLRADSQRYGSLLGTAALMREEAPTDARPKTLTQMPKSTLNPQVMNDFLEKKHKRFIECKGAMKNPPEIPVKVSLSFDIGADGRVGNIQVIPKDGLRDGSLMTCLRNVVLEWAFPVQDETTTYRTTLSL
jgi:hypothetical protein